MDTVVTFNINILCVCNKIPKFDVLELHTIFTVRHEVTPFSLHYTAHWPLPPFQSLVMPCPDWKYCKAEIVDPATCETSIGTCIMFSIGSNFEVEP